MVSDEDAVHQQPQPVETGASGWRTGAPTPDPTFASPEDRFRDLRRIRAARTDGRVSLGVAVNDLLGVARKVSEQKYALAKELDLLVPRQHQFR
ncbi:hypothetical protein [Streptomyces sp. Inha503]|uniref:hypothetical protein n=1 Tax=Streptomyces sp. Inha503 TaxID=3383314 RepID=UPI0039A2DBC3